MRFSIRVREGIDAGSHVVREGSSVTVGSDAGNEVALRDPMVSRHHCVLEHTDEGTRVRDLGSRHGTFARGIRVSDAILPRAARLTVGKSVLELDAPLADESSAALDAFGPLRSRSPVMRRLFHLLRKVAPTDTTVLIEGETGTGKTVLAQAIHHASARRNGRFVVVDCASLPPSLIEAELFGCEQGAFTGADAARPGAFEAAEGGTLFLDDVGELPIDLQVKFLRMLEERTVKRIGSPSAIAVDVRLLAASNRDLAAEVRRGRFRLDLYHRLAVLYVRLPALRERAADLPLLVEDFASAFAALGEPLTLSEADWRSIAAAPWFGNVRELRAAVERAIVLGDREVLCGGGAPEPTTDPRSVVPTSGANRPLAFREAKRLAIDEFERAYLHALLRDCAGNLSAAARIAQMDRKYLRARLERLRLRGAGGS